MTDKSVEELRREFVDAHAAFWVKPGSVAIVKIDDYARALLAALDREKAKPEPPKRTAEEILEGIERANDPSQNIWSALKALPEALHLVRELRADGEKWAAENRELREEKAELRAERDELKRRIEKACENEKERYQSLDSLTYRILRGEA